MNQNFNRIGKFIFFARDDDEGFHTFDFFQDRRERGGKQRRTFEFQFLVFAPDNRPDARRRATSFAFFLKQRRAIAGAVADERHRFDTEGCRDNFADFTVGQNFSVIVENFNVQLFVVQMSADSRAAFAK